jgi:hypothetical protein
MFKLCSFNFIRTRAKLELITKLDNLLKFGSFILNEVSPHRQAQQLTLANSLAAELCCIDKFN